VDLSEVVTTALVTVTIVRTLGATDGESMSQVCGTPNTAIWQEHCWTEDLMVMESLLDDSLGMTNG